MAGAARTQMTYYYHSVTDSPHLPRNLPTDSAQRALITILGELLPSDPPVAIPSAALVDLLGRVGVSPAAARAALSRMSRRHTLSVTKSGRQSAYRLSTEVAASIPLSEVLTMGFGSVERKWNGEWTVVVFSLPEAQRDRRQALREWLRWLGFGPVRDGVWVSLNADIELTKRALAELMPADGLIFRSLDVVGKIDAAEVRSLQQIRQTYEEFVAEFRTGEQLGVEDA